MMGRGAAGALLAASAVLCVQPLRAEIKFEVAEEGIVATNLGNGRLRLEPGSGPAMAAPPGVEVALPAAPPAIAGLVEGAASRYGFDPAFVQAVVAAESAFDHRAVSSKGARGLMQLMPATARRFGLRDLHDPASNLDAGVAYLRELVGRFHGDVALALAAYNAGPDAVARYGGPPPYEETRQYIERIRTYYGPDLQRGDRAATGHGIRLARVETGGVPHYTNVRPRRVVKNAGAGVQRR